ncbi:hypothetical protein EYW49_04040 [Siculibacillus lacustris]|uniref:Uncharacterized protein n=1 Tax=Siculibacillus lacustris TaxID=1549641 RepID=A0A4Q9VVR8_9HYPH|nr:hypothetical protein [Siculibacillus lacustris]TBW40362.1 hypothetical protein EYW49_04040 [Siculibacillus lacustris]
MSREMLRGLLVYGGVAGALMLLSTTSVLAAAPAEGPVVWISGLALLSLSVAMPVSLAIHQRLCRCPLPRTCRRTTAL